MSNKPARFTPFVMAILAVGAVSAAYLGLLSGWLALNESLDAPAYDLQRPLRQFFAASLVIAVIGLIFGFRPAARAARNSASVRLFLLSYGGLSVLAGAVGLLLVIPAFSPLGGAGGVSPDFGHLLTFTNLTGVLWLFLLCGVIPFAAGYSAVARPRHALLRLAWFLTLFAPANYIVQALSVWWDRITSG